MIGTMLEEPFWYCNTCRAEIDSRTVTHDGRHDLCWGLAMWIELKSQADRYFKPAEPTEPEPTEPEEGARMNLHDLTRGTPKFSWDVTDGAGGSVRCPLCESWVPLYAGIVDDWLINSCPNCYASIAVQLAEVPE